MELLLRYGRLHLLYRSRHHLSTGSHLLRCICGPAYSGDRWLDYACLRQQC